MNKKNLPRAIRPSDAETSATGPTPEAPVTAAAPQYQPMVRSKAATADSDASDAERRLALAMNLVKRFSFWSGAAGLIPFPGIDLVTVGGVQIQMLRRLSQVFEVPFSENRGKALIASLAGAMIPASSGLGAASMVKSVPVVGTTVAIAAMPALSAGATYAIGMAFIEHFASGGTLLDFRPGDYLEFIKRKKKQQDG
jgi:uncharacterized protein (DUF697 family)